MHDVMLDKAPRPVSRLGRSPTVELVVDTVVLVISMAIAGFIVLHAIGLAASLLASHPA